jgi:hypothetical protein
MGGEANSPVAFASVFLPTPPAPAPNAIFHQLAPSYRPFPLSSSIKNDEQDKVNLGRSLVLQTFSLLLRMHIFWNRLPIGIHAVRIKKKKIARTPFHVFWCKLENMHVLIPT